MRDLMSLHKVINGILNSVYLRVVQRSSCVRSLFYPFRLHNTDPIIRLQLVLNKFESEINLILIFLDASIHLESALICVSFRLVNICFGDVNSYRFDVVHL